MVIRSRTGSRTGSRTESRTRLRAEKEKQEKREKIITKRDSEILKFINEFGFCELRHLLKQFSLRQSNAYKIMRRLCGCGLVIHDRIFLRRPGVYRLSKLGANYTDLSPLEKVPLVHYDHQLLIIDVFIKLAKEYPNSHWVSERRLLKDQSKEDFFKKKHFADGMLMLPDERQIAIEVELSLKGKRRLEQIFKGYAGQFTTDEVWYFCLPHLISPLKKLAEKRSFIRIHNLKEFLA